MIGDDTGRDTCERERNIGEVEGIVQGLNGEIDREIEGGRGKGEAGREIER